MNIDGYLQRINYTQLVRPDVNTLHGLQLAHMQSIPFENLDIGLKRPIQINDQALWNKLVVNGRGGFCYELNGLFAWLLKQIGFEVTYLNARVFDRQGNLGIDFDHLALLVQIPGQPELWLADVGFGDSFIEPLQFESKVFGLIKSNKPQMALLCGRKIMTALGNGNTFLIFNPTSFLKNTKRHVIIIRHPLNQVSHAKALLAVQPHQIVASRSKTED